MTDATGNHRIVLELTDDDYQRLKNWQPCTRLRLVLDEDDKGRLEIDKRATCLHCHGAGVWDGNGYRARCKYCGGTGLR